MTDTCTVTDARAARKTSHIMSGASSGIFKTLCASFFVTACGYQTEEAQQSANNTVSAKIVAQLPTPHANNAVAMIQTDNGAEFYSFNGLRSGKTHEDVSAAAFVCAEREKSCTEIEGMPGNKPRLASIAVTLYDRIFIFGGYTVADDGAEVSTPEVFAFNPETQTYKRRADMPTPVDDAVAFTFANRYIYLVSGWHNEGNVSIVQVFDSWEDKWFEATPYPGAPVFGHAGGVVGNKFVIADGVAVIGEKDGRRQFGAVDEVWLGEIDPQDPAHIDWRRLPPHAGVPLYRMASGGDEESNRILFYGGADNPYNFNGIGYDGEPANASDLLFAYDLTENVWVDIGRSGMATMDHRGLMIDEYAYWTLGGMDNNRTVIGDLVRITVEE